MKMIKKVLNTLVKQQYFGKTENYDNQCLSNIGL